jgi:hypothetical protein
MEDKTGMTETPGPLSERLKAMYHQMQKHQSIVRGFDTNLFFETLKAIEEVGPLEARIASLSAQVKAMREAGSAMRKELDYKASFDRMFNDKFPGTAELLVAAWDTATKSLDTPTPTTDGK